MFDIPFEIWAFSIIISFAFTAIGFIANPRMHIMIIATALFIAIFAFIPDNIIMGYTANGNSDNVLHYSVISSTGQATLNNGGVIVTGQRLSDSSSALVNDRIDCITVFLGRSGSPSLSAPIQIGIMDDSANFIKQFGIMNVTQLTTNAVQPYEFCLPIGDSYTFNSSIQIVGVKYNGGDGSNTVNFRVDVNNPFDGNNTERVQSTTGTSFTANTGQDMMMILTERGFNGIAQPILWEFNSTIRLMFVIVSILLLTTSMILIAKEN